MIKVSWSEPPVMEHPEICTVEPERPTPPDDTPPLPVWAELERRLEATRSVRPARPTPQGFLFDRANHPPSGFVKFIRWLRSK